MDVPYSLLGCGPRRRRVGGEGGTPAILDQGYGAEGAILQAYAPPPVFDGAPVVQSVVMGEGWYF